MRALAADELHSAREKLDEAEKDLRLSLLPRDAATKRAPFWKSARHRRRRAALFAGDLFRMYQKYAALRGWTLELVSASEARRAAIRNHRRVQGKAFSRAEIRKRNHRVQRVPATETQAASIPRPTVAFCRSPRKWI